MKRQILMLTMALVLVMGTALTAQSTSGNTQLPPGQQVDQSGQPETGSGPDVDVDAGRNAEDGLVDVDVNRKTDSDTSAQGNDTTGTMNQTGTTGTATGTTGTGTNRLNQDNDQSTTGTYTGSTSTGSTTGDTDTGMAGDQDSLPSTASGTPLLGLLGLLSLAGALAIRTIR